MEPFDNYLSYKEKTTKKPKTIIGSDLNDLNDKDLLSLCLDSKFSLCYDQNFWRNRFFSKYYFYPSDVLDWKNLYLKFIYYTDKFKKIQESYFSGRVETWDPEVAIWNAVEKNEEKYIIDALKYFHYLKLKSTPGARFFPTFYNENNLMDMNLRNMNPIVLKNRKIVTSFSMVYKFYEKYKTFNSVKSENIANSILEIYRELKDTVYKIWYNTTNIGTIGMICVVENGSYAINYDNYDKEIGLYAWAETKELSEEIMKKLHNTEILEFCQLNTKRTENYAFKLKIY